MSTPVPSPPAPTRRRRVLKGVGVGVAVVLVGAGGVAWWALDEYVIDHVAIADVAAHEAAVGTTIPRTTTAGASAATATTAATAPAAVTAVTSTVAAAATTPAATGSAATGPVVTADRYTDGATTITITETVTGSGRDTVTYYVADVVVTDATVVRSGFADNRYGENIVQDTSDIATEVGAVFAINGDYYGFRDSGIMIRNGVVYRDDGARTGLALYADGRMAVYDETTTTADALLAEGVWNTLSFGPALVDDGVVVDGITQVEVDTNVGNHSIQGNQPRTAVGMIAPNHFVFVVVDGRSPGYSRGVTLPELAGIFVDLGATEAYNLDGGGSSTMWFNGEVVNDPLGKGKERGTSDIVYVA